MSRWSRALAVIRQGVAAGVFPGACAEAGSADAARWSQPVGSLSYDMDSPPVSEGTVYDLASLTKPIATATVAMRLVDAGRLDLDSPVASIEPAWLGADRDSVTIQDLLEHAAGLPAWAPLWERHTGRDAVIAAACGVPLEYVPRTRSVYSDLGFIVLGGVLERAGRAALDEQFDEVTSALGAGGPEPVPLRFTPPAALRGVTAPTRVSDARERLLVAEADDDNAWAMGGVAGHAGVFGTAAAVGAFARTLMRALRGEREAERRLAGRDTIRRFLAPSEVPGSSRALGWDLMRPASSCGAGMSPSAFGHTGFTGTSLWIDPVLDVYAVLLTNRVHPVAGPNEPMQAIRRAFHDALLEGGGA
ncbi:MAG TPA: serine hydrolase domain-containing protein [Vicinamibacterales bacterium]|nr:serine hydrolase domain-containing protein [Vicinamibacterales bacterium]